MAVAEPPKVMTSTGEQVNTATGEVLTINRQQQKEIFDTAHGVGWTDMELAKYLKDTHGVDKTSDIPVSKLGTILAAINTGAI